MIIRMLIAAVGALAITAVLFLGMDALTTVFREQSTERGYRISDVVRRDRSERQAMPETLTLPDVQELEPERAPATDLRRELPTAVPVPVPALERPQITLDSGLSQPAAESD